MKTMYLQPAATLHTKNKHYTGILLFLIKLCHCENCDQKTSSFDSLANTISSHTNTHPLSNIRTHSMR